jgi:Dyp-type peroxidase family
MGPLAPELELFDIQGNILRGYTSAQAAYLFFSFVTPESGRAFLAYLADIVRDATDWGSPAPDTAVNVALTFAGLQALGLDRDLLEALPDAFRTPMAERASTMLDDRGLGAPETWDPGVGDGIAHLLVTVNQTGPDGAAAFANEVSTVLEQARTIGAVLVHDQRAERLEHRREHFGWADGFGQPAIAGMTDDPIGGSPQPDGTWTFVAAGEFVHGYPDEDGLVTPGPTAPLLRNGTFMVYRKLHQDVVAFRARLRADALAYGETLTDDPPLSDDQLYELAAAKVVGRWRDGMPIEDADRRQHGSDTALGDVALPAPNNDFRFWSRLSDAGESARTNDLDGHLCPLGAHIRRTNPRDALGWERGSQMTSAHRIIRRGMPYGPFKPFEQGETDDEIDRGLIFICFNASIERQFEVVQRQWCNDGNAFALGNEKDYVLGDHLLDPQTGQPGVAEPDGRIGCPEFSLQREERAPYRLTRGAPVVWTRGCEYLLMPGIAALHQLAAGRLDGDRSPLGEADAIDEVVRLAEQELAKTFPFSSAHVTRDQHAKAHGCVHARFEVLNHLPDELRFGLLAEPGTYDAWVRFSSRASERKPVSDAKNDAHGMAIKVLGVNGPKVLTNQRDATTQDFVLANSDTFFCRDATEYVELATKMQKGLLGIISFALPSINPKRWRLNRVLGIRHAIGQKVSNPLQIRYWSQTPYALGPHAVKYSAKPRLIGPAPPQTGVSTDNGLELAISEQLASGDATFDFMVQPQRDPETMPIDDPTVRWEESASPFIPVATIHIPSQRFQSKARKELAENLSFTPWHTLADHQPLGGINRVRRAVYESISSTRHNRNGVQMSEPTSFEDC